jgi:GT2 family glycosyltransferase
MSSSSEFEQLRGEIEALRREVQTLSDYALELRADLRRSAEGLEGCVTDLDARAIQLDTKVRGILESRIWRTLTKTAGVAMKLGGVAPPTEPAPVAQTAPQPGSYELWQAEYESAVEFEPEVRLAALRSKPRFAVITQEPLAAQSYPAYEVLASEAALEGSAAEWVIVLAAGDTLAPDAMLSIAEAIQRAPESTAVYSDHDRLDASLRRVEPAFKPDWSPERFAAEDYVSSAVAFRRGTPLQLSSADRAVAHVPRILFHLRDDVAAPQPRRVHHPLLEDRRVSIIIPTGGHLDVLSQCLDSLVSRTNYAGYEILVADNSRDGGVLSQLKARPGAAVEIRHADFRNRPFNFAAIANEAAAQCSSPFLLFLNDDITVVEMDWLTAMVELAAQPDAGAVGALLLFPDGLIQHAGVTLGIDGLCEHSLLRCPLDDAAAHVAHVPREVSAVTGACMLLPAARFREAGGFDAVRFPVNFNDIDLCLRLRRSGLRILYTPYARLIHHESFTRSLTGMTLPTREELESLRALWHSKLDADPYYNPNLNPDRADWTLRRRPWQPYNRPLAK